MEMSKLLLFSLSLLLIHGVVQSFDYNEKELETEEGLEAMYDRWREHHKVSEKSPHRFNLFKARVLQVHNHNQMNKPYKLKINKFADMSNQEFMSTDANEMKITKHMLEAAGPNCPPKDAKDVPPKIDWRERNAVTPIRTQGRCGSDALFATVGAIEGINAIRTGQLIQLSEQHFLDCWGPGGHRLEDILNFTRDNGIATAESYPYQGVKGTCDPSKFGKLRVTIDGYGYVRHNSEQDMMKAVSQQPVVVITFMGPDFLAYSEGIYTGACGPDMVDLLLVGYDQDPNGDKFWIAKNIKGEEWGEKGYVRLPRGVPQPEGFCSMYTYNIIPLKSIETRNIEL